MPATLASPVRTRIRVGSLRATLGVLWQENVDRLFDTINFFGGVCYTENDLFDPCDDNLSKSGADGTGTIEVPVFGVFESANCTTAADPSVVDRLTEDVAAAFDNHLSREVERGLWSGRDDAVPATDDWYLASSGADDINSGTAVGLVTGLTDLIAAMDDTLGGERGVIHAPHFLLPFLQFYGQVEREGNVLRIQHTDHLLVAGTGYNGAGPDGTVTAGEPWIYGTGPVGAAVSPTQLVRSVDWETNTLNVIAEAVAATYFSPCTHIGVPVCIPDPGPDCGTS